MATVNFINRKKTQSRAGLRALIKYTMQEDKIKYNDKYLVSGVNCTANSAYEEFINTKLLNEKDSGRMYYHFVQSFPKDENFTPETAHEVAVKLAEFYKDFEVLVCTHTDREHMHSHFIVNSVSFQSGKKLHQSAHAITQIREMSDDLCIEYGLSICEPRLDKISPMGMGEYHIALKGKSWKLQLAYVVDECMKYADSKESFVDLMESEGYKVNWTDNRKNITYCLPNGKKCRDNKLHEVKYLKEKMENEFKQRREIIIGRIKKSEQTQISYVGDVANGIRDDNKQSRDIIEQAFRTRKNDELNNLQCRQYDSFQNTTQRIGENQMDDNRNENRIVTGWEKERLEFFTAENENSENRMDSTMDYYTNDNNSDFDDVVQSGESLESVDRINTSDKLNQGMKLKM